MADQMPPTYYRHRSRAAQPLLLLCALVLAALVIVSCGGGSKGPGPTAAPTAEASGTPEPQGRGELVVSGTEPVAFAFAPDGRMFYTERTAGEIRYAQLTAAAVTPEQLQLAPVVAARNDLAQRTDVPVESIVVVSVTAKQWPDSCLGAGNVNEVCAQVVTPGYEVVMRAPGGVSDYTYRTDSTKNFRIAGVTAVETAGKLFAALDTHYGDECGLIGIAVDPQFEQNHYVYVYAVRPVPGRDEVGSPALIRYTDVDGTGTDPKTLLEFPTTNPSSCAHVSGNIHFGADGALYLSVGNFEMPDSAADLKLLMGKILRLNKDDGSAAAGNPLAGRPNVDARIFAFGFRNPFDFAFAPDGKMYAPDNGPGNCDELNLILPGTDYGVPKSLTSGDVPSCLGLGGKDPILTFARPGMKPETFTSNVAPAGVAYLTGEHYPQLGAGLLVCEYVTHTLVLLHFNQAGDGVTDSVDVNHDCAFNVEIGNDGLIYYSNREGIFRIPAQTP